MTTPQSRKGTMSTRSGRSLSQSPKSMRRGVPNAKFKDEAQAKTFFSAPRVAATGPRATATPSAVSSGRPATRSSGGGRSAMAARPSTYLGNNAAIALSRVGRAGRAASSPPTPPSGQK